MAIVKELKDLGKKMTGANLTGNTVGETLKALKENYGGDEPSGGGKFVVTLTAEESGGETVYTGDKTIAEIIEANASGMACVCRISPTTGVTIELPLLTVVPSSEIVLFGCSAYADGAMVYSAYGQTESNVTQWLVHDATLALASDIPSLTGYKKTYEFGFTIESDGDVGYTATPDEGVTIASIVAARLETPLVYAVCALGTTQITMPVNIVDGNGNIAANTTFVYIVGSDIKICGASLNWNSAAEAPSVRLKPLE